jgi:outer membrane protein OmpA-like peptidoglycan-associated protein
MYTVDKISQTSLSRVLANGQWTPVRAMSPGIAVQYYKGVSDHVDFMGSLSGSSVKYPFSAASGVLPPGNNKFLLEAAANLHLKLLTDQYFLVPYFSIGAGASMYAGTYFATYIPTGVGFQFNLGQETFLHTEFLYNAKVSSLSVSHLTYSIGIGSPINEKKAAPVVVPPPPPPPPLAEKDTDGDGIADSKDKCPDVPGIAKYDGCPVPDTDGDGINDENDKCPNVKGIAKYDGCPIPDRDRDGINDDEDKCPDVPGVARYQGCPVPDRDKDGINDEEDKCPDVPGVKENNGCPLVKEETVKRVAASAKNIFFATGSDKLLSKSFKSLDDVVSILKEDQALKLDIEGHTDNTGSDKINTPLSENRAKSVFNYLVDKGIDASRMTSQGFGSSRPVADNKTAKGRALNRRVEMKLKYY